MTRPQRTPIGRYVNALCYMFSGVVLMVMEVSSKTTSPSAGVTVVALAMLAYGLYIAFTRGSYWVSSYTYAIPILAIAFGIASAKGQ